MLVDWETLSHDPASYIDLLDFNTCSVFVMLIFFWTYKTNKNKQLLSYWCLLATLNHASTSYIDLLRFDKCSFLVMLLFFCHIKPTIRSSFFLVGRLGTLNHAPTLFDRCTTFNPKLTEIALLI